MLQALNMLEGIPRGVTHCADAMVGLSHHIIFYDSVIDAKGIGCRLGKLLRDRWEARDVRTHASIPVDLWKGCSGVREAPAGIHRCHYVGGMHMQDTAGLWDVFEEEPVHL